MSSTGTDVLGTSAGWPFLPPRARESLDHLLAGNLRFAEGHSRQPMESWPRREGLLAGQRPVAACFGCVDSRVPVEAVLDQGLGELLTIRTAGHVLDRAVLGSLEYGVHELQIPLIVVLGHERCGAVAASIEVVDSGTKAPSAIDALVEAIRPAVDDARGIGDPQARLDATVRRHIQLTVAELPKRSTLVGDAVNRGQLSIVGARYSLRTGRLRPV